MKSLKFLFVAVLAAFAFVSCEKNPEPGKGNEPEPGKEHTGKLVINWGNAADVNGKTYEIGMASWSADTYELILHVELKNNSGAEKEFTVKEVRKYDLTTAFASLCTSNCMPGDGKPEQVWEIGTVANGDVQTVDLHLAPLPEYDEATGEPVYKAGVFPAEFTFSDGTEEVKFNVNYNFTPAQ